jgi:PhoPQ-activated pathogenicity-related protein
LVTVQPGALARYQLAVAAFALGRVDEATRRLRQTLDRQSHLPSLEFLATIAPFDAALDHRAVLAWRQALYHALRRHHGAALRIPIRARGTVLKVAYDFARETGTVISELRLVPNQPIVFMDDPARKPRIEDDFIAYTWDKFLRSGDDKWPARLPMTKSVVRAMDTVTAFAASAGGGGAKVARFIVGGGSKRGWAAWTTAITDSRVVAIVPVVIDKLNIEPSFVHHRRAYGAWSGARPAPR